MRKLIKGLFWAAAIMFGIVVLAAIFAPKTPQTVVPASQSSAQPSPAQQTAATQPSLTVPSDEQNFANIVGSATNQYDAAANDMLKGAVRHTRRDQICNAFPSTHIDNWAGTIQTLSSTGSGNGVLTVSLNDNLSLSTWNNDVSDFEDHTTIPANSALFGSVSQMKVGDQVYFSGDFLPSNDDCFEEQSLTTDGGMQQPEFVFKFSAVREAGSAQQ